VVTGGGRGVGRAIVERLVRDGGNVVVLEQDGSALDWLDTHTARARLAGVVGSASDLMTAGEAADRAEAFGPLRGWVNNAAIFRDAALDTQTPAQVLDLITLNLAPVVVGCGTAVRRFRAAGRGGAIVNVSSHQAPPSWPSRPHRRGRRRRGLSPVRKRQLRHRHSAPGRRSTVDAQPAASILKKSEPRTRSRWTIRS
jgi:NAD(P)-dependent dehydrogenase (short-subunit alcohol dehydrogenase family)